MATDHIEIGRLDDSFTTNETLRRAIKTARLCRRVVTVDWDHESDEAVFLVAVPVPAAILDACNSER